MRLRSSVIHLDSASRRRRRLATAARRESRGVCGNPRGARIQCVVPRESICDRRRTHPNNFVLLARAMGNAASIAEAGRKQGNALYAAGDLAGAVRLYRRALRLVPTMSTCSTPPLCVLPCCRTAVCWLGLQAAIATKPSWPKAHFRKALSWQRSSCTGALISLRRALAGEPSSPAARIDCRASRRSLAAPRRRLRLQLGTRRFALGHGDTKDKTIPRLLDELRGVRVGTGAGMGHSLVVSRTVMSRGDTGLQGLGAAATSADGGLRADAAGQPARHRDPWRRVRSRPLPRRDRARRGALVGPWRHRGTGWAMAAPTPSPRRINGLATFLRGAGTATANPASATARTARRRSASARRGDPPTRGAAAATPRWWRPTARSTRLARARAASSASARAPSRTRCATAGGGAPRGEGRDGVVRRGVPWRSPRRSRCTRLAWATWARWVAAPTSTRRRPCCRCGGSARRPLRARRRPTS